MSKLEEKKFQCGICGKVYDKIEDRIDCERSCLNEKNKENRQLEIESLETELCELRDKERLILKELNETKEKIRETTRRINDLKNFKDITFKVNGNKVHEDEFAKYLSEIFGKFF